MKENENFWNLQENVTFWQNYYIDGQMKEWQNIVKDWGHSSVQLKKWLDKYYPIERGLYDKMGDINVNVILPYQHNRFWRTNDLYRLDYALKAKLIILGVNGLDESRTLYAVEALRLWLRFDSVHTKLSWKEFVNKVDQAYIETEQDWNGTVEFIQNICQELKPKRKQTMYHFKKEDFWCIQKEQALSEAYAFWLKNVFPTLLDKFKRTKTKEFISKELSKENNYFGKISEEKYQRFMEDLNRIEIKKPSLINFRMLLKKFNIEYKKRN